MTGDQLIWLGYIAVGVLMPAMNSKFLGLSISYMIGMSMIYPNIDQGGVIIAVALPAMLLAGFRE